MMAFLVPSPLLQKTQPTCLISRYQSRPLSQPFRRPRTKLPNHPHHSTMQVEPPSRGNSKPPEYDYLDTSGTEPSDTTYPEPEENVYEASVSEIPLNELKCDFYAAISTINRGLAASPAARKQVMELIKQLERQNPTENPSDTPELLTGRWRLIFTTALDVLSLGLLAPIALVSQVYQNVYETDDRQWDYDLENIVQLEPAIAPVTNAFFGRTMAQVTVKAKGLRSSANRMDITFVESQFRPESFVGFDIPTRLPKLKVGLGRPVGFIETTFLDTDLRVARVPAGPRQNENLFVLMRESEV